MKLEDVIRWPTVVFKVYSSWDLYESPKLMAHCERLAKDEQQRKRINKKTYILAMEIKDFSIEKVVTWSTAVEKETS